MRSPVDNPPILCENSIKVGALRSAIDPLGSVAFFFYAQIAFSGVMR